MIYEKSPPESSDRPQLISEIGAICPFCKHLHNPVTWDVHGDPVRIRCEFCDEHFLAGSRITTVYYSEMAP